MIEVYTGAGKGKTTAAIGLAMRALGAGLRVYIMQFALETAGFDVTTAKDGAKA